MTFFATGDQFSNEIISQFLYGEKNTPADVADEKFIGRTSNPSVGISATEFMAGPGRFARPEFFEAVQRFFDTPLNELLDLIEDFATRIPLYCAHPAETADVECASSVGWDSGKRGVSRPSYPSEIERSPRTIVAVNEPDPYVLALYCEDTE